MNYVEIFKGAIKNLKGNKVRTLLTMLGIIIGIASVIAMSAIGSGGQQSITGQLKASGYGKFVVTLDKSDTDFSWKDIIDEELITDLKNTGDFKNISPKISDYLMIGKGKERTYVRIEVTTKEFEEIQPVEIIAGRTFLPEEMDSGEPIILIDSVIAKQFFKGAQNAVGKTIETQKSWKGGKGIKYYIVGVYKNPLEDMSKSMPKSKRSPKFIRLPLKTYERMYDLKGNGYLKIIVESNNPEEMASDMKKMRSHLGEIMEDDSIYEISIENTGAEGFDSILNTLNIFIVFVSGISLFVGGIGVMNIMLVSIIERTKEIGIRKAIGARDEDILVQFLIEAVTLTFIGGIIGIIFGVLVAYFIGSFINITPIFSVGTIVVSIVVSTLTGVIFGVAPARKASQLNTIEALRAE